MQKTRVVIASVAGVAIHLSSQHGVDGLPRFARNDDFLPDKSIPMPVFIKTEVRQSQ